MGEFRDRVPLSESTPVHMSLLEDDAVGMVKDVGF